MIFFGQIFDHTSLNYTYNFFRFILCYLFVKTHNEKIRSEWLPKKIGPIKTTYFNSTNKCRKYESHKNKLKKKKKFMYFM